MQKTLLDGSTQLPAAFDPPVYRQLWPDLADFNFDEDGLRQHYERFGINEGRQANALTHREDFVRLIPANADSLEIGPFYNPLLRGSHTRYFDVMDKAALEARSRAIGAHNAVAPEIDFISPIGDLSIVDADFDYILSSHCIEHQPDLVEHLQQVSRLLRPGGRYFLLVPDKRFCFDALLAESTIADVLDAHHAQRKVHALKSVVEH